MVDQELSINDASEKAAEARRLAEQGLHEQAVGNNEEADRLLAQALEIDPDTVADVLREHDAGRAPDARLQDLADQVIDGARNGRRARRQKPPGEEDRKGR